MREPEIVEGRTGRDEERYSYAYFRHHRVMPGWLGKVAAGLTVLAAAAVIAALLFGKILLLSAAATALWPLIFSAEFTRWVFGAPTVPFWKILLLFTFAGFATRWIRGWTKG